jgi:hypothetical protein
MNVIENNKLLVEFMGLIKNKPDTILYYNPETQTYRREDELQFHTSWDWIMQVVDKIENLGVSERLNKKVYSRFKIHGNHIQLDWVKNNSYLLRLEIAQKDMFTHQGYARKEYIRVDINENASTLEAIYLTCVEFVKWFNKNNEL